MKKILKVLFFLTLVLSACSGARKIPTISAENIRVYPEPPDKPRIQYLTSISNSKDIVKNRSGMHEFVMGKEKDISVSKPYGIAFGNDKLYICDLDIKGLQVIDLKAQSFKSFVPKGFGALKMPVNCFFDKEENKLYVADSERKQIVVFDSTLQYVASLGGDSSIVKPVDVAVHGEKIFVSDSRGKAIHVYDKSSLELIDKFPKLEKGQEGFLYMPMNINVTSDKLYVTDFGEFIVKTYSHEGEYLGSIGSFGRNIGQFVRPKGIATDREDNVYVVDAAFENVQVFNDVGELLLFFGGPYKTAGDMWLPANVIIDYDHNDYFKDFVFEGFDLQYLILVTNMFGQDKVNLYGFVSEKK